METPQDCAFRELSEELLLDDVLLTRVQARLHRQGASFLMPLHDTQFVVTLFVIPWEGPDLHLSPAGRQELSEPAWRLLQPILSDLWISRNPPEAGKSYARAVCLALIRTAQRLNQPIIQEALWFLAKGDHPHSTPRPDPLI